MNKYITISIIIFIIMVLIVAYSVATAFIKKYLLYIILAMITLIYFFVKPFTFYSSSLTIKGNSLVKKMTCFPKLYKCKDSSDKIMFTVLPDTRRISENKMIYNIIKDDSFDILKYRIDIQKLFKESLNIDIPSITSISFASGNLEITTGDCAILGNIIEGNCQYPSMKKTATYNVSRPSLNKLSCIDYINTLTVDQKKGYDNFVYNSSSNTITGIKECLDIDCSLNGNIVENICDPISRTNNAYYNIIPSAGEGVSCSIIANRLTNPQMKSYSNWVYNNTLNRIQSGPKGCIPDISCSINGSINTVACDTLGNEKKKGYYNVTVPSGKGKSCQNVITDLTIDQKQNYSNWTYDISNNIIIGESECCSQPNQVFYNGSCYTVCPTGKYLSKSGKICLDSCKLDGSTVIDDTLKKCLTFCPDGKSYTDVDTSKCYVNCNEAGSNKFSLGNKCYSTCPDGYYNDSATKTCIEYSIATKIRKRDLNNNIPEKDKFCISYDYKKDSDDIDTLMTNKYKYCNVTQDNSGGYKDQLYCLGGSCKLYDGRESGNSNEIPLYIDSNKIISYRISYSNVKVYDYINKKISYIKLEGDQNIDILNGRSYNNYIYFLSKPWNDNNDTLNQYVHKLNPITGNVSFVTELNIISTGTDWAVRNYIYPINDNLILFILNDVLVIKDGSNIRRLTSSLPVGLKVIQAEINEQGKILAYCYDTVNKKAFIYYSSNKGNTFSLLYSFLETTNLKLDLVNNFEIEPNFTWIKASSNFNYIIITSGSKVYLSSDFGNTFNEVPNIASPNIGWVYIRHVNISNDGKYKAISNFVSSTINNIYTSSDFNSPFILKLAGDSIATSQFIYSIDNKIQCISNSNNVAMEFDSFFISNDYGNTWSLDIKITDHYDTMYK